jgi:hypothetical protein
MIRVESASERAWVVRREREKERRRKDRLYS